MGDLAVREGAALAAKLGDAAARMANVAFSHATDNCNYPTGCVFWSLEHESTNPALPHVFFFNSCSPGTTDWLTRLVCYVPPAAASKGTGVLTLESVFQSAHHDR